MLFYRMISKQPRHRTELIASRKFDIEVTGLIHCATREGTTSYRTSKQQKKTKDWGQGREEKHGEK
jgi:hypothetical protein